MNLNTIYHGDCLEVLRTFPDKSVDLVLCDPPYPDYHTELYGYHDNILEPLKSLNCRQFIFWSAKVDFPLDYTAIHIWDKVTGAGAHYERIFERNGHKDYKVYREMCLCSTVGATIAQDAFSGHPSQKPIKLLMKIIGETTKPNDIILDPFCGSGSTLEAASRLGRRWIGIDIEERWVEYSRKRMAQGGLF